MGEGLLCDTGKERSWSKICLLHQYSLKFANTSKIMNYYIMIIVHAHKKMKKKNENVQHKASFVNVKIYIKVIV